MSIPAPIRRRWATDALVIEDLGDRVVLRPIPKDPIAAAKGAFRSKSKMTAAQAMTRLRREEREAEERKFRR